jgi:hypothetical protein
MRFRLPLGAVGKSTIGLNVVALSSAPGDQGRRNMDCMDATLVYSPLSSEQATHLRVVYLIQGEFEKDRDVGIASRSAVGLFWKASG